MNGLNGQHSIIVEFKTDKKSCRHLESVDNISGMQMNNVSLISVGEHQAMQVSGLYDNGIHLIMLTCLEGARQPSG